jgi:hypothetical protein
MHLQMLCGGLPTNKLWKGLANLASGLFLHGFLINKLLSACASVCVYVSVLFDCFCLSFQKSKVLQTKQYRLF